jgi:uncharacterized membrane protein
MIFSMLLIPMTRVGGARISLLKRLNIMGLCLGAALGAIQPSFQIVSVLDSIMMTINGHHIVKSHSLVFRFVNKQKKKIDPKMQFSFSFFVPIEKLIRTDFHFLCP